MEYRFCLGNEFTAIRRLWSQSFGEEEPWTSWYFSNHYKATQTWIGVESGEVVAQVHMLPYLLFLRGAWRETVYFVGVCVEEKLRGKGIGRELLATAIAELRRKGTGISILQPRWPVFYRQLGWDFCYSRKKYSLPLSVVQQLLIEVAIGVSWTPDTLSPGIFADIYEKFVQERHGFAKRDKNDWQLLLADHRGDGGKTGLVSCDGKACAYVFYKVVGETLYLREMTWTDYEKVDPTLKHLLVQFEKKGLTQLEWDDPSNEPVSVLSAIANKEPFLMGRLTNVQVVLETMEYPPELSVNLVLELSDPLVEENQGRFLWQIEQGRGRLVKQSVSPIDPITDSLKTDLISIDIASISQLYFGQKSVREIIAQNSKNLIDQRNIAILDRIFPVCRNYISEYF